MTFSTAKDAWLNEGVTSYVENRIIEALYGKERADMELVIERNELKAEFTDENKPLQELAGKPGVLKDPDDNLSSTVYTKGAWFMQFLEQRFGRENFDAFLRGYFDHFAFQSISSQQFADYAKANLLDKYPGKVTQDEFDAWLYEPGVPSIAPQVDVAALRRGRRRAQGLAGGRHAAGRRRHRQVDDAGMGALHRRHAARRSTPRSWKRSTRRTSSPARRTARSRSAGIRSRCAAVTRRRIRRSPSSCSRSAAAS